MQHTMVGSFTMYKLILKADTYFHT